MRTANYTDYAVIGVYLLLMISVGLSVVRYNRSASEYFKGGSRVPWLVAGLSAFMSGFSSWTFTGGAGYAYRNGIAAIALFLGNSLCFLLGYYVFATRWRRSRITTVMEYLSARFNQATHQTFSWATIIFQLFTSASVLYGLSFFVSTACQLPVRTTILVTGGIILFYCVVGGLWAVVLTDFLQCAIVLPFCVVLVGTSIMRVGGIHSLLTNLPAPMKTIPLHGEAGWFYILSWTVMVTFGYNTSSMAQRYFSVENEKAAQKVALLCSMLFFVGSFLWFLPPMAMRILYPDLHALWPTLANPSEAAYVVATLTFLPHGLIGIMLAAMFSSTMANLSANFNVKSGILTKDIYQRLFRPSASDRELLLIGWLMTLLVGSGSTVLAMMMAKRGASIFEVMMTFNGLFSLCYGPPALMGLAFRRSPQWSGLASFIASLSVGIVGVFFYHWTLIMQVAVLIPIACGVFLLSSLFDHGDWSARAELFQRLNTPINPDEIAEEPDYSSQVFRLLAFTVASIGLLSLLLLLPAHAGERAVIFAFSAITLSVAAGLQWLRVSMRRKSLATP